MFCCETCKYKSNRKFNLQKHIKNVHSRDATDKELTMEQISSKKEQISSKLQTQISPAKNVQKNSKVSRV